MPVQTSIKYLELPYVRFDNPLNWQKQGLQQTASGYGKKLTSSYCIKLDDGRVRRIYITQYSNAGSAWVILNGTKYFLRDFS